MSTKTPRSHQGKVRQRVTPASALRRVGGHPAIDFVNTVDVDLRIPETLHSFNDLLGWLQAVGVVSRKESDNLKRLAAENATGAQRALKQAITLREALRSLFTAKLSGVRLGAADLQLINRLLRSSAVQLELEAAGSRFVRRAAGSGSELREPIGRLALLGAEFLASSTLQFLAECEAGCGWFFIDRSPTRRRRWCSMAGCGNRAKAQRFYHRHSGRRTDLM